MTGNMQKARKQCSSLIFLHDARKRILGKAVFISRIIVIQKMDLTAPKYMDYREKAIVL